MRKYTVIPAISGHLLAKLLRKDGWEIAGQRTHGIALIKKVGEHTLVTIVPTSKASLPIGTLKQILGDKQTKLGNAGLLNLLNKYGL